ncbi:Acyl-CoA synthetase (AMP-forming)/AMP-acid ligase II [Sulfitobacter marinus]|uniref:Acyl-CoA synthetase (AMP-forming)/AMP-acid ligase II n=1 Tax=Sulfitobacter marinus TaxID=394264 RepID=A0A1I6QWK8_9RHOB|nr:class I adenylate-forming enzyme family protein [Sulfitobacter marinus]SFS56897.1 Acyl-CoA synthetase (AMP-forming)/AMP-acid ligase II [Sulfitobacter marinus]
MLSLSPSDGYAPCPAPFNMAAHVLTHAGRLGDKTALRIIGKDGAENWSYHVLESAVRGTATGLLALGLKPGDIVLMRLGNTVDFPLAYLGALAAGLVPVPTAAALTEPEVSAIIDTLRPKAILRDPLVPCPKGSGVVDVKDLRTMRDLPPADWHMGDPERLGYIIYTSGTSGKPSAVMHAHRAIWARQMMYDGWYDLRETDRVMHAGAFNWTYTLGTGLMDPWTMGATALIPAAGTAAADLPQIMRQENASLFAAAPGVYRQILKHNDGIDIPSLRHGLSAGEKLPEALRSAWQSASGTQIYEAYGMSECSTFLSGSPARPAPDGSLGYPQPGRRVALIGPDGPVPYGTEGTIAVYKTDPGLMLGYFGAPEQTAEKFQDGWFMTGDQGVMGADGQITYLGRNDDMMNAGGFRVSPIEVEQKLAQYPGITAIGATEVSVRADVTVIAAFYTADSPLDEAALALYAQENLARYKQPRLYVHLPELPMGANGKLLRRALRAGYEAQND